MTDQTIKEARRRVLGAMDYEITEQEAKLVSIEAQEASAIEEGKEAESRVRAQREHVNALKFARQATDVAFFEEPEEDEGLS